MAKAPRATLLTIEENARERRSIGAFLEESGFEVIEAPDGEKGLEVFREKRPDLVLTDLRMPGMDGLEVIDALREESGDTPVIVVSGTGVVSDAIEAVRRGAWDYVTKPIHDMDVLEHVVVNVLERVRLRRENQQYQTYLEDMVEERTEELRATNSKLRRINERLSAIVEATHSLRRCSTVEECGLCLLKELKQQLSVTRGSVCLCEKSGLHVLTPVDDSHTREFIPFPLPQGSILGRVIRDRETLLLPGVIEADTEFADRGTVSGEGWTLVLPLPDDKGGTIGVLTAHGQSSQSFTQEDGEISSILASCGCEILRSIRISNALQTSEERYRTLFEETAYSVVLVDPETGRLVEFNDKSHQNLGYTREEFGGLGLSDIEVIESSEDILEHINKVLTLGRDTFETKHRRKSGELRDIVVNAKTLVIGEKRFLQSTWHDVTEHKRADRQLRKERDRAQQYLDLAGVTIVAIASDETVTLINRKGCEVLGYDESQILGKNWFDMFLPERIRRQVREVFESLMLGTIQPVEHFDNPVLTRDGEERLIHWHNTVLRDDSGEIIGTLTSGEDITDGKRIELELARYRGHLEELVEKRTRELQESQEQLQRSARLASIGTLAAGIAHEINNPLGSILMRSQLARAEKGNWKSAEVALLGVESDVKRCARIIRSILKFARDEPTEHWPLDANERLKHTNDVVREYASSRHVKVQQELSEGLPSVRGNPTELEQVLVNLARNAIEASNPGQVVTLRSEGTANVVRMIIEDNGKGMDTECQQRAFDPFYTTRQQEGGTGLGLSVSHGIVTYMGGSIRAERKGDRGTAMIVELPACSEHSDA